MIYEELFNTSPDIQCIANLDGYFTKVNPAFCKVLGKSAQEIIDTPIKDHLHPDDFQRTMDELAKNNIASHTINFENRYRHADGSYRTLSWVSVLNKEGTHIYGHAHDITEQKQIKHTLDSMYSSLSDHAIVAITDQNGIIENVNDEFCRISGYTKHELVGQDHRLVNSGVHTKKFMHNLWSTIKSGKTWSGVIQNKKKNGDYYFVQSIIFPIIDNLGEITNFVAIRFDMTDQINLRDNLSRTLDILNETSSIAKVGGWELIVETGELNWTDETFNILEVEKKNGQKPILPEGLVLFSKRHQPIIEKAVNDAIEKGIPYSLELEGMTAKGNLKWVYTNGRAHYEDGKVVSLSGTIQDIHDKKMAELKLEQERLKSVQQSRLASLGEISAGIAHEINNPLTVISLNVQSLKRFREDPEAYQKKIATIQKSCDRIDKIIKSLKKFIRSNETGTHRETPLKQILIECMDLTEIKAKKDGVKLTSEINTNALIMCDEVEIEQVFINLINNAIDAVKETDERWVKVIAEDLDDTVIVRVIDAGLGIEDEIAEKLFEPFFTTKNVGEGTGLGLSITKGIIDEHKANIYIDKDYTNTCFAIEFARTN